MANEKETVPGLGFKDKEKAEETIKNLEGRDADYQKLAVKGLIGRAKRTLQVTKAEDKVTNIKEALSFFEKWLKDFEKLHIPNWSYLPLATLELFSVLKKHFDINNDKFSDFLEAYKSVDGDYKKLRTVSSGKDKPTWDIVRNNELRELMKVVDDDNPDLWDDGNDLPTEIHAQLLLWAYSPDASKIKKHLSTYQEKLEKLGDDEPDKPKEKKVEKEKENGDKKTTKRKSSGNTSSSSSSSGSDEESPVKKRAVE